MPRTRMVMLALLALSLAGCAADATGPAISPESTGRFATSTDTTTVDPTRDGGHGFGSGH